MKIKLNYPWQSYNKGDVIDLGAAVAEAMTRTGQATYLSAVRAKSSGSKRSSAR